MTRPVKDIIASIDVLKRAEVHRIDMPLLKECRDALARQQARIEMLEKKP
jgi:hypothetical protein